MANERGPLSSDRSALTIVQVQAIKKKVDPITSFRAKCLDAGLLTADQVKAIDKEVKKHIEEETEKALSSPEPSMDTIANHITKTSVPYQVRACHQHATHTHQANL